MIVSILIVATILYIVANISYTFFNNWCFSDQRSYMTLKELMRYKNAIIISGGGASIKFDYEWGIKFTPLTFWYYIYLCIGDAYLSAQIKKDCKETPPWRLK